jgi:ribokinase
MAGRVVVVGSANLDLVVEVERRPAPGETVLGTRHRRFSGGKGANQAVAAARVGAEVTLVACVGDDPAGGELLAELAGAGVDTASVRRVPEVGTGTAFVTLTPDGENSIIVSPGANAALAAGVVDAAAPAIAAATVVCAQLEVPLDGVRRALELARRARARTVLTPAPAVPEARELIPLADVLVPNLGEARALAGDPQSPPRDVARRLLGLGAGAVVLTLGARGVVIATADGEREVPARAVPEVVDTTGAGDTLAGVLAAALAGGAALADAVRLAVDAAGISVTRAGAQASMPTLAELRGVHADATA